MKCSIKIEDATGVLWHQELQVPDVGKAFELARNAYLIFAEEDEHLKCTIEVMP